MKPNPKAVHPWPTLEARLNNRLISRLAALRQLVLTNTLSPAAQAELNRGNQAEAKAKQKSRKNHERKHHHRSRSRPVEHRAGHGGQPQ